MYTYNDLALQGTNQEGNDPNGGNEIWGEIAFTTTTLQNEKKTLSSWKR